MYILLGDCKVTQNYATKHTLHFFFNYKELNTHHK